MATKKEISDLKASWIGDPCWDIEETEGFEEHKHELREFSLATQKKWSDEEEERINNRCKVLGCTRQLLIYIESLEQKIDSILYPSN